MLNQKIIALIKREVRERLLSKTFVYTTIALPLLMFLIIGLQAVLFNVDEGNAKNILVVSDKATVTQQLEKDFSSNKNLKSNNFKFSFATIESGKIDSLVNARKKEILKEKLTGIIFIPSNSLKEKKVRYYSKTPNNFKLREKLSKPINKALVDIYFEGKDLSPEDLKFARSGIDFTGMKVSEKTGIQKAGYGNLILAYLFTFLLYLSLLMIGQLTMQSVMEEKNNRIVEVILSSVNAKELMAGKILGSAIIGVAQMAIWLSPVILIITTSLFALPPEIVFEISIGQIVYLLINYFLGLLTFLGLFAMVGSIFENAQDAQSGIWPIMLLILIPFFIAMALMENPNSLIGEISSMAPFFSIIVMPAKMTLVDVPLWKFIVSIVVNILTILAVFPIAGKIYRVGILRTGKKPKWSEVVKWLKYKGI